MQAHARFEHEAWSYDKRTLAAFRDLVLLHGRRLGALRARGRGVRGGAGCR